MRATSILWSYGSSLMGASDVMSTGATNKKTAPCTHARIETPGTYSWTVEIVLSPSYLHNT